MKQHRHHNTRAAFSLVEVALAMLVVGVGLLGVFALFPAGTEANRKSIVETQVSHFAEYILNGFRYEAEQVSWNQVDNTSNFRISPLGSGYTWKDPDDVMAGPGVKSISFKVLNDPAIEEMAFRYEFEVGTVAGRPDVKYFMLDLWPGLYGQTDPTNSYRFYTEIFNYGGT